MARLGGSARPRSSPPAQGSSRCAPSYAPTGEPTLSGAPLSPCFAAESTREGTLMSLPEGAPARSGSGAEGGCPVGTRTNTAFRAESKRNRAFHAKAKAQRKAPESSDPGVFCMSIRRQSLPRRRSPPQPSAREYAAAPYPAPSPPGTRPRGELNCLPFLGHQK